MDFPGKVTVITGGASGIGAATARAFAKEGARVIVADLNEAGAKAVADEIDGIGRMIFKEKMDVNDVINSDAMVDVLSQYAGDDLSVFDFVGKVENFDNDLIRFQDMFGLDKNRINKIHKSTNTPKYALHCTALHA